MNSKTLSSFALRAALVTATTLAAVASGAPPVRARQQPALAESPKASEASKAAHPAEESEHYSCPMHPSVKSSKPGRCPKCKMELRPTHEEHEATSASASGLTAKSGASASAPAADSMSIPDVELLDQDGRKVRFYSDLVKDRVVAINFIFTTCTTICPPLGATFARVQKELGERAGRDVHFISVSVDPVTDTPERLKAWGAKFKAGPGWTFVTGAKPQVDELLRALAASSARREDHTPTVLVGNDARKQWTRAYGLTAPSRMIRIINDAAEGRLNEETKESK